MSETDFNGDGQIWVKEWFNYAARRVPRLRWEKIAQTWFRLGKSLELVETADQGKVQTPRVFYRREPDAQPRVVARVR